MNIMVGTELLQPIRLLGVLMLGAGLMACGSEDDGNNGSDGEDDSTSATLSAPVLSWTAQSIRTFAFSWPEVGGATEYRLLENPDDASGYTEIAVIDGDATSHELEVFLPGRINASYILEACNSQGCTDSEAVFVDTNLDGAVGYVKASNGDDDDEFGFSVALAADGQTLAIGSRGEQGGDTGIDGNQSDNSANASGAVYVFVRDGSDWSQQAYVKASNTDAIDYFGTSVALSGDGDTLVVGARLEDSAAKGTDGNQLDNSLPDSGAAYVFAREGTQWSQQAYLKASNARSEHDFGYSVAVSTEGNTIAVGARYEDSDATGVGGDQNDDSSFKSGAVYVFSLSNDTWSQQAYLKASNTDAGNWFGVSVDLSADGNILAVGASNEDSGATGINGDESDQSADRSGAVFVFGRNGDSWSQQAYIKASNTDAIDQFGFSVALSADGNTLAVGAYQEDSRATGIDSDQYSDDSTSLDNGAVYVFEHDGSDWNQQAYVKASSSTSSGIWFGGSIDLSADGDVLAVGAKNEESSAIGINGDQEDTSAGNSGATYVFRRDGTIWSQQAYIKAKNTATGSWFGIDVALSADGRLLAVGSTRERSGATGVGGDPFDTTNDRFGAVYLY